MALRTRGRNYGSSEAVETPVAERSPDRLLEDICHELKLIDIKRKAIRDTTARLPFYYAITGLFGFLLAGSVLAISLIFIFVFGGLFSGALANIVGPVGALTLRKRAYADIAAGKERLFPMLPRLPESYAPVLVGVAGITRSSILFTDKHKPLKGLSEPDISTAGVLDLGSYKYLAVVFRDADGTINLKHDAMRRQYWLTEAKLKGHSDAAILGALEKRV